MSTAALADCTYSITDEELARAKQQLKAASLMRRDSVGGMMESTARQLILFGEVLDRDKLIADIDNVTKQQVMDAAANLLSGSQPSVALTGPQQLSGAWLACRQAISLNIPRIFSGVYFGGIFLGSAAL